MKKYQKLEELYADWNELEAYRILQCKSFDFGNGLIVNESKESEDVYYKMEQQAIDDCIYDIENEYLKSKKCIKNSGYVSNYYMNKAYDKQKLNILKDIVWWAVHEKKNEESNYMVRSWFATNKKRFYKKYSNKQVRRNNDFKMNGNSYKKVFDFWWEIW